MIPLPLFFFMFVAGLTGFAFHKRHRGFTFFGVCVLGWLVLMQILQVILISIQRGFVG